MKLEWLMIADAAEVWANKLYLMGGGWDKITVRTDFPVAQHLAVAVSILLEPEELGQAHEFVLDVQSPAAHIELVLSRRALCRFVWNAPASFR